MSDLTVLIKTPGSAMSDIWQTGLEMLGCTLASALLAVICGYLAAQTAAGFSYTIREKVFNQVADFGQYEMQQFSVPSLINRTTNDITQIQMLVAMGLQIMIKSPIIGDLGGHKDHQQKLDAVCYHRRLCRGAACHDGNRHCGDRAACPPCAEIDG